MPIPYQVPMRNRVILSTGQRTGICMAVGCFWVQRCVQLGQVPGAMDQFFTNWQQYETMGVTYETLLADHNNQTGGNAAINNQNTLIQHGLAWLDIFTVQLGLHGGEVNWGTDHTLAFLLSLMDNGGGGGYILNGYRVNTGGGFQVAAGHTVAFYYDAPGMGATKSYLDPNFGQWTVLRTYNWIPQITADLNNIYQNFNQWALIELN